MVSKLSQIQYDSGCSSRIRILTLLIPSPGSMGQKGNGSRIRIRNTELDVVQTKIQSCGPVFVYTETDPFHDFGSECLTLQNNV
jgi:hypothetical protein